MNYQKIEASEDTMRSAIQSLKSNFKQGETRSIAFRKAILQSLRRLVKTHEKDINDALKKDLGLSSYIADLTNTKNMLVEIDFALRYLSKWAEPQSKDTPMLLFPGTIFEKSEPMGTVLIIGAWNYPFPTTMVPFISAVAAGNCVIIKPSENAPESSRVMSKIVSQLDERFYRCIEGAVETSRFLNKQAFDLLIFTGGTGVGKFIMKDAADNLCPVLLELGGKNPTIVDLSANIDLTAKRLASFKFLNAGQTCTAGDFVFVHSSIKDAFITALIQKIKEYFGADAKTCKDYSRIVNDFHCKRVLSYLEGQQDKIIFQAGSADPSELFVPPTLVLNPSMDSPLMKDEIFGPLLPIIEFKNFNEIVDYIQNEPKSLAIYYFGDIKSDNYNTLKNRTSSGSLMANDLGVNYMSFTTGFGGVGHSGVGKIRGFEGFRCCSHQKVVIERSRSGFLDVPFRYPPFTPAAIRQMKFFMENFGSRTFGEIFRKFQLVGLLLLIVAFLVVVRVLFSRGILVLNLK